MIQQKGFNSSHGPKAVALFISMAFSLTRGVYFALPPSMLAKSALGGLMLFEIPGLVFFIMYNSLLYIWSTAIYNAKRLKIKNQASLTWNAYIGYNIAMVIIFIIFAIVSFTIGEAAVLPCKRGDVVDVNGSHRQVNLAYLIFLAALSSIMAIGVIIAAAMLLRLIGSGNKKSKRLQNLVRMTILILATFPIMFVVRTLLLIIAAADSSIVIPLIVFSLLEVIPTSVLLYYIFPVGPDGSASSGSTAGTTQTKGKSTVATGSGTSTTIAMSSNSTKSSSGSSGSDVET